jgi:hypothetical protein
MKKLINATIIACVFFLFTACTPQILDFSFSPNEIETGQPSRLTWVVTNANFVEINPGIGKSSADGSIDISPESTTEYSLSASNAFGTVSTTATINVNAPSPEKVATPYFSPHGGIYTESLIRVRIASATSGATIRFTTNGMTPSDTVGTVLPNGGFITLPDGFWAQVIGLKKVQTVKAVAYETGRINSIVVSETYTFLPKYYPTIGFLPIL